ncbi:nitrogenase molybdenum-iron protein subunit beta [Rhodobacter veldkampii DSM 11550]|uniref:Nitrogenase molybdenum-iron protein beta chain n=1 Tax=Phaeovulum veldkampii DSM 11550 TaxID=1185920 RepID=A0A2T4JGI7_9RHOB|nr:nitrogenase molybdenum-iron protein subunit beta [Phaeovulum veldkampii]MBK5947695.1 nitrogenase molybdenum-iron protein subunit beta [Phaeovulum veldkampii DSM 11550]PTE17021.1 nitrogenase molybdenum-iron protein subunit beta [Phaeovulum veldkampii DSM 11550]TDQ56045.1 Mo-nitrogenase MoFe protein subunit NifK [Phaeovulum veldkampii DSM 11550]
MPQSADNVLDHAKLFHEPEYKAMLDNKRATFECGHPSNMVTEIGDWTKSWDYREKNLAREALTINPAKACQPLGAVFAAAGYEGTMSFVHGSQGCVAYYRSHLARHFKEPSSAVSSSMTEDAAVFGGLTNMVEGLANTYALYNPKMIAVSTTCMAEVIGDDLNSFIIKAKEKESVPEDFPVPFAHTPAFVGSHVDGYDNMQKGILTPFWKDAERAPGDGINIIPGFDGYAVGNIRELKRMLGLMGVQATVLSDVSDVYDTPSDGEFRMYSGGTTQDEIKDALNAKATISMQEYCSRKTLAFCEEKGQETSAFHYPMGVQGTDELLMKLSELTGKEIPEALRLERGRLVDAMADSQAYLHGKTYAIYGDPDFVYSMARFVMETGGEPKHCLATNGGKDWAEKMQALLASSPFGQGCQVWAGKDLWHLRSILATEPADMLIGNSYGKYLERDLGLPLIRLTFPIFDRHHHHRFPTWGYQGALNVLVKLLDTVFDKLDSDSGTLGETDISFDLTR